MSRSTYYVTKARRPKNCWDCDGLVACKCDVVTIRAAKRSSKAVWDKEIEDEIQDYYLDSSGI